MTRYNLHNLIEITVDPRVSAELSQTIDFQIGYFRADVVDNHAGLRINVRPYADWLAEPPREFQVFHLCHGDTGRWLDLPQRRCAYVKHADGFTIYADTGDMLINLPIQFLLAGLGITLVHAAAVADPDGRVTLLPGPGGVGKTAVLGSLVKNHGYRLLGDDVVGIDGQGNCYAFPRSFVLKAYHRSVYPELFTKLGLSPENTKSHQDHFRGAANLFVDNMPLKGLTRWVLRRLGWLGAVQNGLAESRTMDYLAAVPVHEVFGPGCVVDRGVVERVVFLERWTNQSFEFEAMDKDAMTRRLLAIIHHEWVGHMLHFWTLGSMEVIDLPDYFQTVTKVIGEAVSRVPCERLRIPNQAAPDELSRAFLSHQEPNTAPRRKAA